MMNFVQRVIAFILALGLAAAAVVFASFVLALGAAMALVLGGWLWWRTRHLRREMRQAAERSHGTVIEGEYRVERESRRIDER